MGYNPNHGNELLALGLPRLADATPSLAQTQTLRRFSRWWVYALKMQEGLAPRRLWDKMFFEPADPHSDRIGEDELCWTKKPFC
ncbi:hypothetical protein SBV1_740026 [Verrucomicrobia bacterium]|nr:hypothetical protein SBV1_740026 [Verrucomicrobiota bacterium]